MNDRRKPAGFFLAALLAAWASNTARGGEFPEAAAAFERAAVRKDLKARALYNRACALAPAGKSADALSALRDAVSTGSFPRAAVEGDSDLDSLHGKPEFAAILASLDRKS